MSTVFLLYLFSISIAIRGGDCGYTEGAPCSVRNTALLVQNKWRMPRENVACVDLASMETSTVVPSFYGMNAVTTLYADRSRLHRVPINLLVLMPELELLDLSGNHLRRLQKDVFASHPDLRVLLLTDNRVYVPKGTPLLLHPRLDTLSLSYNKIKRLRPWSFVELPGLAVLYLDNNLLEQLPGGVFEPLVRLKYLHLGNNRLRVDPYIVLWAPRGIVLLKGNPFDDNSVIIRR